MLSSGILLGQRQQKVLYINLNGVLLSLINIMHYLPFIANQTNIKVDPMKAKSLRYL